MRHQEDIHLQWVIVDSKLRKVSDFETTLPKNRPVALCPVCSHQVTLKLGTVRVHHCAHKPGDDCVANQPETAVHLNTKFHIYNQLLQARKILIKQDCEGDWDCEATRSEVWLENWDKVEVEYTVNSFRPDIALLSEGVVVGAIEVFVTHAVDEAKSQFFEQQNIPWLEIRTDVAFYQGKAAWKFHRPLPFFRQEPEPVPWMCDECIKQDRIDRERDAYARDNYDNVVHAAKMVDIYYNTGTKDREVYYVIKSVRNGEWIEAWVKIGKNIIGPREKGLLIPAESLKNLNAVVARRLQSFRDMASVAFVDTVITWRRWEPGLKFVARDFRRYPYRYKWRSDSKEWEKIDLDMSERW